MESRACFLVPTKRTVPPRWATSEQNCCACSSSDLRLEQVDDVDAATLTVDEAAHLWVPAARLVSEMHSGLQQLPDADVGHRETPLNVVVTAPGGVEGSAGPGASAGQGRLPRAPGGSPGSKRSEMNLSVYASFVPLLRWCLCGPTPLPLIPVVRSAPSAGWGGHGWPPHRASACAFERRGEVGGERRANVDRLAGDGMGEGQVLGVQELALEPEHAGVAVLRIAGHGMADRLQVRADLVRAPGLEAHAQQRVALERLLGREVGDRGAPVGGVGRDARADAAVAAQRRLDLAGARARPALDERQVLAQDPARLELRLERRVGRLGAGDDEQPGRVAVEPVDQPGAPWLAPGGAAVLERLGERARAVPARRVHDDARRLVDDEEVLVLPDDVEARLGRLLLRHRRRVEHLEGLAAVQRVALHLGLAVDEHAAGVDRPLRRGARAEVRAEEDVEPLARGLGAAPQSAWRGGPSST